jgi:putative sigma-54 modulation protein
MNVRIQGVHVRLSDTLKAYVDKHLVQPLARICQNDAASMTVHLVDDNGPKGGIDKEVRVTVRLPEQGTLHVSQRGDDLYAAICIARDRVETATRRALSRRASHRFRQDEASP